MVGRVYGDGADTLSIHIPRPLVQDSHDGWVLYRQKPAVLMRELHLDGVVAEFTFRKIHQRMVQTATLLGNGAPFHS